MCLPPLSVLIRADYSFRKTKDSLIHMTLWTCGLRTVPIVLRQNADALTIHQQQGARDATRLEPERGRDEEQ